ncbi:phosphocarrier protein [Streptomyces sp. SLBN-118]|uniref:HPr family phosphocarrier protein n=1 Tax=Streptomyces sp. SLBN-118 TaxID=2768454 RepID=UPI001150DEA3|nr:HPr family phosphocarrier protein [Streptomyces sp. SLBN-118]TQK42425.1 phosphocarrier protein [Streptomyces sp. SLBN-118]
MAQRVVSVGSGSGLYARPAATLVQAAVQAPVPVTIAVDGKAPVPAGHLLGLMALGVGYGDQVTLTPEGDRAEDVLDERATLPGKELDS